MSIVTFSVPQEVKQVFNETFAGQNKSAIIAGLMLEAVERARTRERSLAAYKRILKRPAEGAHGYGSAGSRRPRGWPPMIFVVDASVAIKR